MATSKQVQAAKQNVQKAQRAALLVTGHRVRLRELLGDRASAKPTSAR